MKRTNRVKRVVGVFALLFTAGCPIYRTHRPPPRPMPTPIAIPGINSPYDDFNSADASRWYRGGFVFSTNRGSEGNHFDLYKTELRWSFPQNTPNQPTPMRADDPTPFAPEMMSDADERAPIIVDDIGYRARLVFASNRNGGEGGLDLYVAERAYGGEMIGLRPLTGLNTSADEAYLTTAVADHQMLFASNRDKSNDIFIATWDARDSIEAVPYDTRRVDELSSPADDTAPFVYKGPRGETEVVFVSTRAGALGEHDLYCSRYVDTRTEDEREWKGSTPTMHWTAPVHLKAFSSPRDEYRPITLVVNKTQFLIFSSTREGGQGGYDLYVVGYAGCPG